MKERKPKLILFSCKYFFAILIAIGINASLEAQNIDYDLGCPNATSILANQLPGSAITFAPFTAINGGAITIEITDISVSGLGSVPGPYTSPFLLNSGALLTTDITFTITGGTTVSLSTPASGINPLAAGKTITFSLTANGPEGPCLKTYSFKVITPASLMLVLDGSGSMGWGYDGSFSPPPDGRRWDGLKAGVGAMRTWLAGLTTLVSKDSLGLRYFASGVIVPAAPFAGPQLVNLQANFSQLDAPAVLPPNPPGGSTALGDGIFSGTTMLTPGPANTNRAMVVFSDGQQNTGDQIREAGGNAFLETVSGKNISNGGKIKIHTVGLGLSGSIPATMSSIATANGGGYHPAETSATDFATFFAANLVNIFAGRSPQIVSIRKAAFPVSAGIPAITEQSFSVNKGATSVIVTMFAPTSSEAHFISFSKGGTDMIQFASQSSGPGYRTITLKFPITGLPAATPDGDWTVRAQLGTGTTVPIRYTMVILTDDHRLEPDYLMTSSSFKEGEVLNPNVKLFQLNKPITNATIQAIVVRPGDNVDDLLARSDVSFKMPPTDSTSPDVAKLAVLMQDSNFVKKIMGQNQIVNLAYNAGDSTYKGSFNGLNVSGVYKVIYLISANDAELGNIQRYHEQGLYVRFPDIDFENSNAVLTTDPSGKSVLTARFITTKGKFVGAGWKSAIHLDASGVQIERIDDVGDGTYKIYFNGKLSGNGKLTVANETFYDGDLSKIGKAGDEFWKQWWFWVLLILILLILFFIFRKKKP